MYVYNEFSEINWYIGYCIILNCFVVMVVFFSVWAFAEEMLYGLMLGFRWFLYVLIGHK